MSQQAIDEGIQNCRAQQAKTIHFVSHSLGGILIRHYLSQQQLPELARVVMLGPPNQGSELAEQLTQQRWFPGWAPPPSRQLGKGSASIPLALGKADFELGVVAGTKNRRPLLMSGISNTTEQVSDGTVLVDETKLEGMRDFIRLPVTHTFMMWNSDVIRQIKHFLVKGKFKASTG